MESLSKVGDVHTYFQNYQSEGHSAFFPNWPYGYKRVNGAEKSRPPKGTSRTHYLMYIPDFKFLVQLGGELCEEQIQKMRKNNQNTISLRLQGGEMGLKSRDPQKALLRHLLNVYTEFQLLSLIRRGDMGRTAFFQSQKGG